MQGESVDHERIAEQVEVLARVADAVGAPNPEGEAALVWRRGDDDGGPFLERRLALSCI
jgi:hypothetical protein